MKRMSILRFLPSRVVVNSKQQWDHASIDGAYHGLLDYLADLLDRAGALGLFGLLPKRDPLLDYLRVAIRSLRRKMETDPANPRLIVNEPGVGYRVAVG